MLIVGNQLSEARSKYCLLRSDVYLFTLRQYCYNMNYSYVDLERTSIRSYAMHACDIIYRFTPLLRPSYDFNGNSKAILLLVLLTLWQVLDTYTVDVFRFFYNKNVNPCFSLSQLLLIYKPSFRSRISYELFEISSL